MSIILKPIISEKATSDSELNNRYSFVVDKKSNKIEIKKAVETYYQVNVIKVRTMNYGPVRKTKYTKTGIQNGKSNLVKKAIVQLEEGEQIDFYNNI
ncbi:MAG: 50S ribosomal protein L23 [Flavobacteriaceae bacterium]|jgi:large subunit ribosomal protein L23|nr:50S ribosomal protein L23 [Flavobacteriaceae bacterium]|tara:strand:- start:98 stop:388 length:291 start_codon:yes stop_codon:yes gene_type:complete